MTARHEGVLCFARSSKAARRLSEAFRERKGKGPIYLFFSVNGSGHFCGVAQMMSEVDYNADTGVW